MAGTRLVGLLLVLLAPLGAALRLDVGRDSTGLRVIFDGTRRGAGEVAHSGVAGASRALDAVASPLPSLLCFMVVRPGTREVDLMQKHLHFPMLSGCDRFVIYSNVSLSELLGRELGAWERALMTGLPDRAVISGSMSAGLDGWPPEKPVSYTAANSYIFMPAWHSLLSTKVYQNFDWTVKLDPDTAFFPERLRELLKAYSQSEAVGMFDDGRACNNSHGMGGFGVVSKGMMMALDRNFDGFLQMGNDVLREDALLATAVMTWGKTVRELNMLLNAEIRSCREMPWKAAYHPFKNPSSLDLCFQEQRNSSPPVPALLHSACAS